MGTSTCRYAIHAFILILLTVPVWRSYGAELIVSNTSDNGPGTLREALTLANSNGEPDTITFNFGSTTVFSIMGPLPVFTEDSTTLNGGGVAVLDGSMLPDRGIGLVINSANNAIENLMVLNFPGDGISIMGVVATGNRIQGCQIGTDGTDARPNKRDGVRLGFGASNNLIGGVNAANRNIISGNGRNGVAISRDNNLTTPTSNNIIQGNYIGTGVSGNNPVPNGENGVRLFGRASTNIIGGVGAGTGNLISGNREDGIAIEDGGTTDNVIQGNRIGTKASGTASLPNRFAGIRLARGAEGNFIGGNATGAGNLVSGNEHDGIVIRDGGTTGNFVLGNFIGTDIDGLEELHNGGRGVDISFGARQNYIGGPNSGDGNLISGNRDEGIRIQGAGSFNNTIRGNTIGLDINGDTMPGNAIGIVIRQGAANNSIGGLNAGDGNTIADNGGFGILIEGGTTIANSIRQNSIKNNRNDGIRLENGGNANLAAPIISGIDPVMGTAPVGTEVEIFADAENEGATYIATLSAASGTFSQAVDLSAYEGRRITATATGPLGNTSAFSTAVSLPDVTNPGITLIGGNTIMLE